MDPCSAGMAPRGNIGIEWVSEHPDQQPTLHAKGYVYEPDTFFFTLSSFSLFLILILSFSSFFFLLVGFSPFGVCLPRTISSPYSVLDRVLDLLSTCGVDECRGREDSCQGIGWRGENVQASLRVHTG